MAGVLCKSASLLGHPMETGLLKSIVPDPSTFLIALSINLKGLFNRISHSQSPVSFWLFRLLADQSFYHPVCERLLP